LYEEAGKIASKARNLGYSLLKEGILYREVVEVIEDFVKNSGARLAFPVNISVNECAAHDTSGEGDERCFEKGDLVKLDIGVHLDGYIADTAVTKEIGSRRYVEMIRANEEALRKALKVARPGVQVREIGKVVEEVASKYGFNVIKNLTGHSISRYELHAGLGIPNYDNKDKSTLEEGMVVAIEPFFTDGVGYVIEKGEPKIFRVVKKGRVGRELLKKLEEEYHGLPFSKFWVKDPKLSLLCREGALKAYPPLVEKSGGMVSQFEHTLIVGGKVTTK